MSHIIILLNKNYTQYTNFADLGSYSQHSFFIFQPRTAKAGAAGLVLNTCKARKTLQLLMCGTSLLEDHKNKCKLTKFLPQLITHHSRLSVQYWLSYWLLLWLASVLTYICLMDFEHDINEDVLKFGTPKSENDSFQWRGRPLCDIAEELGMHYLYRTLHCIQFHHPIASHDITWHHSTHTHTQSHVQPLMTLWNSVSVAFQTVRSCLAKIFFECRILNIKTSKHSDPKHTAVVFSQTLHEFDSTASSEWTVASLSIMRRSKRSWLDSPELHDLEKMI